MHGTWKATQCCPSTEHTHPFNKIMQCAPRLRRLPSLPRLPSTLRCCYSRLVFVQHGRPRSAVRENTYISSIIQCAPRLRRWRRLPSALRCCYSRLVFVRLRPLSCSPPQSLIAGTTPLASAVQALLHEKHQSLLLML